MSRGLCDPMRAEELQQLLSLDEGPTLEFKQTFYLQARDGEAKRRMKDEFIKDVLSLANGNVYTAGEEAHLIIGVSDLRGSDGKRELYDMGDNWLKPEDLLQTVNSACQPPLRSLTCETILLEGKSIIVITIPFSPHVHETTRPLDVADGKGYSEYVVFTRQGSSVRVASSKERTTLQDIKRIRYEALKNAPPALLGAGIGAIIGGPITKKLAEEKDLNPLVGWGLGTVFFGLLGASLGKAYSDVLEIRLNWKTLSARQKTMAIIITIMATIGVEYQLLRSTKEHQN